MSRNAESLVDRFLRRQSWMDSLAMAIQKLVVAVYRLFGPLGTPLKNIAHGTWVLHHPLHPALTDVPLGAWMVVSPHSFFTSLGAFAPYNPHYERDTATFILASAFGAALAVRRPAWRARNGSRSNPRTQCPRRN